MKKTAILLVALLIMVAANAQEKRKVGNFTKLNVKGPFDVTLVSGKGDLTITTSDQDILKSIITEVKDNTLTISFQNSFKWNNKIKYLKVEVPFTALDEILLTGSGSIVSTPTVNSDNLKVTLTGSGDIDLKINSKNTAAALNGSGDLTLSGKTTNLEGAVVGSGDLKAFGLIAENTEITVSGSGDGKVYASENIKARVIGSGDIIYKGNPKKEDTKVSGSGDISKG